MNEKEKKEIISYLERQIMLFKTNSTFDKKYAIRVFKSLIGRLKGVK